MRHFRERLNIFSPPLSKNIQKYIKHIQHRTPPIYLKKKPFQTTHIIPTSRNTLFKNKTNYNSPSQRQIYTKFKIYNKTYYTLNISLKINNIYFARYRLPAYIARHTLPVIICQYTLPAIDCPL